MARVDPVPGAPAATARPADETLLVVADYHAGVEATLRREGVEAPNRAEGRRSQLVELCEETAADRVVVLGDLGDSIGAPGRAEREELSALVGAVPAPITLVPGNHDPGPVEHLGDAITVTEATGVRIGDVGFAHGHTWPDPDVLAADVVCVGHEHPTVRIEDSVGGSRVERAWLRGPLLPAVFADHYDEPPSIPDGSELIVFPAYNELTGGTWVNVEGQEFLASFLPEALPEGTAYLLDGTNLGAYRDV